MPEAEEGKRGGRRKNRRLSRATTRYVAAQDRIRLSGEVTAGGTVVVWLTQRLLLRVLPHLFAWLDRQAPSGGAALAGEAAQGFAQEQAVAALQPQLQVRGGDNAWLAQTVDFTAGQRGVRLTFKGSAASEEANLVLGIQPLRQWLHILYSQWRTAEWPDGTWPGWLTEVRALEAKRPAKVLH